MPTYRERSIRPEELHSGRLTRVFAVLAVVFVATLAAAPLRPYFAEWRGIQKRYNQLAAQSGGAPVPIAIQQIWKPDAGVTDRCVTCHLGMGTAQPVPGDRLFAAHPPIPHDPRELGCTICHGGQGRGTTTDAAHGFVSHWDEQLVGPPHQGAGCGSCHDAVPRVSRTDLARGAALAERLDCLSCHRTDGRGRGNAADLSAIGLKGFRPDWHAWHLAERDKDATGVWRASYDEIPTGDLSLLDAFLRTRVGMPKVVEAQALANERGCLGCHKIRGDGGDEGPALDTSGLRPIGDLDFSRVAGEATLVNYMRQHLLDPPGVVAGSLMPPPPVTAAEADLLTTYILFLRRRELPAAFLPKDRLRRDLLGEADSPLSGEAIYGAYCRGCHNAAGEGRNYGNLDVRFPAIGGADFLDVVTDHFLETTLKRGRLGRRMPALGAPGGSLDNREVMAVVAHLRTLGPVAPTFAEVERAPADLAAGAEIYASDCTACHGAGGEGTPLGSPLAARDNAGGRTRQRMHDALAAGMPDKAMPAYRAYDARTVRSVADFVSGLPPVSASRAAWKLGTGNPAGGEATYARVCAGCHGMKGEGGKGPALANAGFRAAGTREYVAMTVIRGRSGTPMPAFGRDSASYPRLTAQDALDVAAFVLGQLGRQ
jgi:cytochrome c